MAFFFWPVGGFLIFLCPVDERQRWVQTASTVIVQPQQPVYAQQPQYIQQPQYVQPPPQMAYAQAVPQQQPQQPQPVYAAPVQAQPAQAQAYASAPPAL